MKRWLLERQLCIPRLVGWLVCLRGKNIDLPLKCSLLKSPLHLGTVQSQEPGTQSECPPWVPGTLSCLGRASGITNYLSEDTLAECWNQMQNPNCNPGTWTWDASISSVWTTSSNAPSPGKTVLWTPMHLASQRCCEKSEVKTDCLSLSSNSLSLLGGSCRS